MIFIDNQREAGEIFRYHSFQRLGIWRVAGSGFGTLSCFIIPNALYDYYGESRSIERLYPTMLRYLDYFEDERERRLLAFWLG